MALDSCAVECPAPCALAWLEVELHEDPWGEVPQKALHEDQAQALVPVEDMAAHSNTVGSCCSTMLPYLQPWDFGSSLEGSASSSAHLWEWQLLAS